MRRKDREVTDFTEIVDILTRADTIRLALHDAPYPYVLPLSFGLEAADGKIALYFHGALEGFKLGLIARDPHVCVEADIFHRYTEVSDGITTEYESVIGFGICERVYGGEAVKGADLLCAHCGYPGYVYDHAALEFTAVYKVTLERVTGKRNIREG